MAANFTMLATFSGYIQRADILLNINKVCWIRLALFPSSVLMSYHLMSINKWPPNHHSDGHSWDRHSGFPVMENNKYRAAPIESVLCTLYIRQTIVSEDIMVSSVSSPMPTFFSKPCYSLNIFHDDGGLPCLSFKDGCWWWLTDDSRTDNKFGSGQVPEAPGWFCWK